MDNRLQNLTLEFSKLISGRKENFEIDEVCTSVTVRAFNYAIGAYFVRHFVDESARHEVKKMTEKIRKNLKRLIAKLDWIAENDKVFAYKKIAAMVDQVGYPEHAMNDTALLKFHKTTF